MMHVPGRKVVKGPALIRLLARLTDARLPESEPLLADRLVQWLGWTDAIALSAALGGKSPTGVARDGAADHPEDALCTRVRTSLANAIAGHAALIPRRQHKHARHRRDSAALELAPDYATFRQCYLSLQEQMESAIGNLRMLLRERLASRDSAISRLASMDAVMERVLGIREHNALAAVPGLLAVHFERLRDAHWAACADTPNAARDAEQNLEQGATTPAAHAASSPTIKDGPWLDTFRKDMQSVLFAELDIRFQPVEGLRAALRTC